MTARILVVIPARNAETALPELVARVRASAPVSDILVVDDGSTDRTPEVAAQLGVRLISFAASRGKGEALRTGFHQALRGGFEAVIQMDADLQHEPECIPAFVDEFLAGRGDVILGTRDFRTGGMPLPRRMSNRTTSWLIRRLTGQPIRDSQCGFRLIARRVLDVIHPTSCDFAFESEFLVLAARAGFRIGAVPIATVYRGESTFIKPWRDTIRFLRVMSPFLWKRHSSARVATSAPAVEIRSHSVSGRTIDVKRANAASIPKESASTPVTTSKTPSSLLVGDPARKRGR